MAGIEVASLFTSLKLVDEMTGGLSMADKSLSGFAKSVGSKMAEVGKSLTVGLTLPIVGIGVAAVKAFSDSETTLAQLDAVLRSTSSSNGKFAEGLTTSTKKTDAWNEQLTKAQEHLTELQTKYDSTTKHTAAMTSALNNAKEKVDELNSKIEKGTAVTKTLIDVQHMARQAYIDLSKSLESTTRFSDEEVLSAENMLLTFTNIGKKVFPDATSAVLDMSTALREDTKSSAIQLGKALQDPILGVTALRRVGVAFTDSQKNMIEKLVKTGHLMDAQKIILKELKTEFGGSAVAAGSTFAGSIDKLKNKFGDLLEVVGAHIVPVISKFIVGLSDLVGKFDALDPHVIDLVLIFGGLIAAIGPVLGILGGIATVIGFILSPIGLLIAGVAALGVAFATNFGGIRDVIQPILDKLGSAWKLFTDQLGDFVNNVRKFGLKDALLSALNLGDGKKYMTGWIEGVLIALGVGKDNAITIVTALSDAVKGKFDALGALLVSLGADIMNKIGIAIQDAIKTVTDFLNSEGLKTFVDGVGKLINAAIDWIIKVGAPGLVKAIGLGIQDAIVWIIKNGIPMAIDAIKKLVEAVGLEIQKIGPKVSAAISAGLQGDQSPAAQNARNPHFLGKNTQPNPIGDLINSIFGFRASGGPVAAGGSYLVGERGPELLQMGNRGGNITPNGGGMPSVLHIILRGEDFEQHIYKNVADAIRGA